MKKLLLVLVAVMLFALVGCGGSAVEESTTISVEVTEEQKRITENNAVIQPKLAELEAVIVEFETLVSHNNLDEKYKSAIAQLREEHDGVTKNHQAIIDMGGYLEGTEKFEGALDEAIVLNKEILALLKEEIALDAEGDELVDRFNKLIDLVNEVTVKVNENGWSKNEELLLDLGAVYGFFDEVGEKLSSSDVIEETYRNEKLAIINELIPLFQIHLETVSLPFTE